MSVSRQKASDRSPIFTRPRRSSGDTPTSTASFCSTRASASSMIVRSASVKLSEMIFWVMERRAGGLVLVFQVVAVRV